MTLVKQFFIYILYANFGRHICPLFVIYAVMRLAPNFVKTPFTDVRHSKRDHYNLVAFFLITPWNCNIHVKEVIFTIVYF